MMTLEQMLDMYTYMDAQGLVIPLCLLAVVFEFLSTCFKPFLLLSQSRIHSLFDFLFSSYFDVV
jgi:hypothetical protein